MRMDCRGAGSSFLFRRETKRCNWYFPPSPAPELEKKTFKNIITQAKNKK